MAFGVWVGAILMAVQNKDLPRFSVVMQKPNLKRWLLLAITLWFMLAAGWLWLFWQYHNTDQGRLHQQVQGLQGNLELRNDENARLKQALANAERAEFISRSANNQLQASLADKDERIAGLKADMDFYQRLVGASGRRHGLNVHQAHFAAMAAGAWRYTITLTQNINRGGTTTGQMRFAVEGVQNGKLQSLSWGQLLQNPQSAGQSFAFRYFQELEGNIMLPSGFSPQRVRVSVIGGFGKQEQVFDWSEAVLPANAASAP
jgi:hypothetical protein